MAQQPCTYIMASMKRGTLYIGVTRDIAMRCWMHREGKGSKFCARYRVKRLVHLEFFDLMAEAIAREKQLKNWRRQWKIELIERDNPDWSDLFLRLNQ
ncbi:GIY-YIG nuclease family protein [Maricaulis sp.]|uniref:GIY-YIG nuclease family protein n=1 Tax=Maricaulis sp. TaxID=1486257 RepID=UPI0026067D17|nr:GIY-YIG nuclease family protein [Maricaulis sp.]